MGYHLNGVRLSDLEALQARLKAALADTYDIQHELGSGGMAHVFLAHDIKHDREVAVKVFRPELASSLGGERFLREIHIAAKLSHPHILPLYDSGTTGDFLYYVMPLVEGESLGDRIEREQQLPFDDALQITGQVADALNYAHSRGLVHRDIKPDNIMLSGGHAVVMDFGIARAVSAAGGDKLTQTGMAVGTPAYMSPEQAMGEEVDGRADIYSLGCVLYEMLVGQIPFTGPTPQAVMARHSMEAVPRPQIVRDTIPDDLEDIILCALNKVPADRFRTAGEFADALKAVSAEATFVSGGSRVTRARPRVRKQRPQLLTVGLVSAGVLGVGLLAYQFGTGAGSSRSRGDAAGLDARSVAVLYFEDLSPDGSLGYVADGLTEGLIRQLRQVRELDVISRNGVAPYRHAGLEPDSIGRALGAGSVIVGSIEPAGDDLRFSVRLVDGASGVDLERATLTLPAADLLAAQGSVVQQVARILRQGIGQEVRLREQRAATNSNEAWVLVQRGEKLRKDAEERITQDDDPGAFERFDLADSVLALAESGDPRWAEP
ncbi:MAG: protein kinase, partial [Gemmatimonadetes bacterium]|nr:protein kinase [Gemmatimonadota bacterium]